MHQAPAAWRQAVARIRHIEAIRQHLPHPGAAGSGVLRQHDLGRSESRRPARHGLSGQTVQGEPPAGVALFDNHPRGRMNWNGLLSNLSMGTNHPPRNWLRRQARDNSGLASSTFATDRLALPAGAMFTMTRSR